MLRTLSVLNTNITTRLFYGISILLLDIKQASGIRSRKIDSLGFEKFVPPSFIDPVNLKTTHQTNNLDALRKHGEECRRMLYCADTSCNVPPGYFAIWGDPGKYEGNKTFLVIFQYRKY